MCHPPIQHLVACKDPKLQDSTPYTEADPGELGHKQCKKLYHNIGVVTVEATEAFCLTGFLLL